MDFHSGRAEECVGYFRRFRQLLSCEPTVKKLPGALWLWLLYSAAIQAEDNAVAENSISSN